MNILRGRGIKTGVFQVVTVWPFPDYEVKAICRISKAIFVPELNMGQMIGEVEKANSSKTPVIGINKVNSLSINPSEIVKTVEEVIRCL